jgi:hypothetical protein
MEFNQKIDRLLKILKSDIEELNACYKNTLKDPFIEAGFEYNKKYPYNPESIKNQNDRVNEQERLIQIEVEKLYGKIFHFTQSYFAIKDWLVRTLTKKKYPELNGVLNDYFCNEKVNGISRIDYCNELKHNPNKDLHYKSNILKEQYRTNKGMTYSITNLGKTWFYDETDSVQLCNFLYDDLNLFLEKFIKGL